MTTRLRQTAVLCVTYSTIQCRVLWLCAARCNCLLLVSCYSFSSAWPSLHQGLTTYTCSKEVSRHVFFLSCHLKIVIIVDSHLQASDVFVSCSVEGYFVSQKFAIPARRA